MIQLEISDKHQEPYNNARMLAEHMMRPYSRKYDKAEHTRSFVYTDTGRAQLLLPEGEYEVLAHFYGNNSARLAVPTVVLLVRDRNVFAPEDQFTRRFQTIVLGKADAVLTLRKERW